MEEISKQVEMKNDIISSLHDSILIRILSFLKAKEAVHTCLLSKRWRNLWACLPSLDFTRDEFESRAAFKQFVNSVLLLRKTSHLDTFQLDWDDDSGGLENLKAINVWICHALAHKPRVVFINCEAYDTSNLPISLFSCDSIRDLSVLLSYTGITNPGLINLPNLKRLKLGYMTVNSEFLEKILSVCPLLEELELLKCQLYISGISSKQIKRLIITGHESYNVININTPNLNYLHLSEDFKFGFSLKSMPSLYRAYFCLSSCPSFDSEILHSLSNVTELVLIGAPLKDVLKRELQKCPRFKNLNDLTLDKSFEDPEFDMHPIFLKHSPNLEDVGVYDEEEDMS